MKKTITTICLLVLILPLYANNIRVSNVVLTGKNTTAGTNDPANHILVQFDLSWENSWRTTTEPNNWDAAWVFIKYRVGNGAWAHAFLNNNGHTAATGSTIDAGLLTPGTPFNATTNPAIGVFVSRSTNTSGNNDFKNMQLRWNYRANGVDDNAEIQAQVFAIEMVYVPEGAFTVGDGASSAGNNGPVGYAQTLIDNATKYPTGGCCGGGSNNEFHQIGTAITNNYPNGFNAYYAMKYPITQIQYADFLNTLTRTQQANRHAGTAEGNYMAASSGQNTPLNRNGVRIVNAPATGSWTYACDLNPSSGLPNGVNQADDGLHIACNFLNYSDLLSYLDWAGIRPLTVMEFEKLSRGPSTPVLNGYPWGTDNIPGRVLTLNNAGTSDENVATGADANVVYNQMSAGTGPVGPVRVGLFATSSTTRISSGASYYGALHLGDNVHTFAINVASAGRTFSGSHGNGALNNNGFYDATNWPGTNATSNPTTVNAGFSLKGSCWMHGAQSMQTSRHAASEDGVTNASTSTIRTGYFGGRGVRSAP
jgi:formylglycine-generating enzyme required for sulfatase activity